MGVWEVMRVQSAQTAPRPSKQSQLQPPWPLRCVPAGRLSGSTSVSQTFLINTVSTFAIQLYFNVITITICYLIRDTHTHLTMPQEISTLALTIARTWNDLSI